MSTDCPSICLTASRRVVSGQKCLRDLDLSVKILNDLNHFLGHWWCGGVDIGVGVGETAPEFL